MEFEFVGSLATVAEGVTCDCGTICVSKEESERGSCDECYRRFMAVMWGWLDDSTARKIERLYESGDVFEC